MSTAEWGVLLGIIGSVTGMASLVWRVFEWWEARRPVIKVLGSAGRLAEAPDGQEVVLYGPRFGEPGVVTVNVINKGRRATVTKVGFYDRESGVRYHIVHRAGQLPAVLDRGQSALVAGNLDRILEKVSAPGRLLPYCEDAEGRMYTGKVDGHFKRAVG